MYWGANAAAGGPGQVDTRTITNGSNNPGIRYIFNDELGGVPSSTDYLVTVIDQEAARLGKSSQVAAAFASQVVNHWKAGGYVICMASDCSAYKADYSVAGVLTLPAKTTTGTIVMKSYAYSDFVNASMSRVSGTVDARQTPGQAQCSARSSTKRPGPPSTRR